MKLDLMILFTDATNFIIDKITKFLTKIYGILITELEAEIIY